MATCKTGRTHVSLQKTGMTRTFVWKVYVPLRPVNLDYRKTERIWNVQRRDLQLAHRVNTATRIWDIRYKYVSHGQSWLFSYSFTQTTAMHRLTTGIRSEKCVFRRFRRCANVIECTYTNLDSTTYYTPRLYCIAYYS